MAVYSVPVVIGVDEERIVKGIEKDVEAKVVKAIKDEIWKVMFAKDSYYQYTNDEPLRRLIRAQIDEFLKEKEDKIVMAATTMLAEKLARTKAVKEKAASVVEAVLKEDCENENN